MSQTATKGRKQGGLVHRDGCPADRIEMFGNEGPRGAFTVTRCLDCGEQAVEPADLGAFRERWMEGLNETESTESEEPSDG